jgi:nitrate reductase gamma subunit
MAIGLALATYFGYMFLVFMYSRKIVKYLRLPIHLRSEVYPIAPGERSHYESLDGWSRPRGRNLLHRLWFLLSDYFLLKAYFARDRSYWIFLYPWHLGFILIIAFHICSFFGALASLFHVPVSHGSPSIPGNLLFWLTLGTGAGSFTTGLFGSIGILIKRSVNKEMRDWTTPQNYFTYALLLAVFLSGFYSWYFTDPTFSLYRDFWKGLITFEPIDVEFAAALHILLFAVLLIYLPFTRSLHYVTRIFAFLFIQWDDEPNLRGSRLEGKIREMLRLRVNWSGSHIRSGSTWEEAASAGPFQETKERK